jgi:hypothetical protein
MTQDQQEGTHAYPPRRRRTTLSCAAALVALAIAGCGESSTETASTSSASKHAHATSLAVACKNFGHYLSEYNYIEKGTSVRAYDILFHEYQRGCPEQARAEGEAWPERRKCNEPSESRFDCTAYHDDNIIAWSARELEEDEE